MGYKAVCRFISNSGSSAGITAAKIVICFSACVYTPAADGCYNCIYGNLWVVPLEMISWTRPPKILRHVYSLSLWQCWLDQNVLFSFDDGPSPYTEMLLDLAVSYNHSFAFFLLPEHVQAHPSIVLRMANEGHVIGSHFFKHRNYFLDKKSLFLQSVRESIEIIQSICQHEVVYCRSPYGRLFPHQQKWLSQAGYKHVFWSLDSKDYLNEPADKVIERIQKNLKNKDIVLMHDGPNGHPELVKIVEQTLKSIN